MTKKKNITRTGALSPSAGFPGADMIYVRTDSEKLLQLAEWFDMRDRESGDPNPDDEVQRDLRRIVKKIEGL